MKIIVNAKNADTLERLVCATSEVINGLISIPLAPFGYACGLSTAASIWSMERMARRRVAKATKTGTAGKN